MGRLKTLWCGIGALLPDSTSKKYKFHSNQSLLRHSEGDDSTTKEIKVVSKPNRLQRGLRKLRRKKKKKVPTKEDGYIAELSNTEDSVDDHYLASSDSDGEAQQELVQQHKELVPGPSSRSQTRTVQAAVWPSPIIPQKPTKSTSSAFSLPLKTSSHSSPRTEQAVIEQKSTTYQDASKGITFHSESSTARFSRESPTTPTQPEVPTEQLFIVRAEHHECWDAPPQSGRKETRCFDEVPLADQQNLRSAKQNWLRICKSGQRSWFTEDRRRFVELKLPPSQQSYPVAVPQAINSLRSLVQSNDDDIDSDVVEINGVLSTGLNNIQQPSEVTHQDTKCPQADPSLSTMSLCHPEGGADLSGNCVEEDSNDGHAEDTTPISDQHAIGLLKPSLPSPSAVTDEHGGSTPANGDEDRLTAEQSLDMNHPVGEVLDKLEVTSKTQRSQKPDNFDELIREISLLVNGFPGTNAPLYCPAPRNYYKVLVQGKGLNEFEGVIKDKAGNFPGYTVIVSDMEPYRTTSEGLPIYTKPLANADATMPYHLQRNVLRRNPKTNMNTHVSTVGAFAKDERSRSRKRIFGLTACHSLTTAEEENRIMTNFYEPEAIFNVHRSVCKDVIGRANLDQHLSIALHNGDSVELKDSPFIAYTHYIPVLEDDRDPLFPFQKFTCDIALLPVDPEGLDDSVLMETPLCSPIQMHAEGFNLEEVERPRKQTRIAGYIDIQDQRDIDLLRENNVRLVVGGTRGTLEVQPGTLHTGTHSSLAGPARENRAVQSWILPSHFFFSTEEPLRAGHSGAPVMVYNMVAKELYIIGLLMGQFIADRAWSTDTLYQAMPLSPALKQLQHLYPDHLERLRLVAGEKPHLTAHESLPLLSLDDSRDTGYVGSYDSPESSPASETQDDG